MNTDRISHIEELLDIQYEKLNDLEKGLALQGPGVSQTALKQQIKRDVRPEISRLESELATLLADTDLADDGNLEVEAQAICDETAATVDVLVGQNKNASSKEVLEKLEQIQSALNAPGKSAAAKLKVSLPIIPLISSYELELDTESTLKQVWDRVRSFFRKNSRP